jgi:outer membrane protein OmpA-like peptidoglycan-associated protein/cell division protein FtsN/tetratricopeptide (TPR) repeat protein
MKRLTYLILPILCLLALRVQGQVDEASNYYGNRSYQAAIVKFEKHIAKNGEDAKTLAMLADCYRRTGQTELAEATYAKCVKRDQRPVTWMYYAQMAFTNGNHEAAEAAWMKYADLIGSNANARRARAIAAQCARLARRDSSYDAFEVQPVSFNSGGLDFSPVFRGDGELVFASNRNGASGKKSPASDPWTGANFVDLYRVTLSEDHISGDPVALDRHINSKYHEASASFSTDGSTIYFTRSDYHRSKRGYDQQKNTRLKIYRGQSGDNGWKVVEALQFNSSEYSSCHPALSPDGEYLVFASDRPGGKGGMDLYLSRRNGESWSSPVNLGAEINTPGNEVFPSISPDGRLIFSSDFHVGYGGYDVFYAEPLKGKWTAPENFGAPINSARDDLGLVLGSDLASGYFASNRDGFQDDIYYFSGLPSLRIEGVVMDCQTGTLVPGAEVRVMEGEDLVTTIASDEMGQFSLSLPPDKVFTLHARKDGYFITPLCSGEATLHTRTDGKNTTLQVSIPISKGSEIFMRDKCCFTLSKKADKTYPADRFTYQWVLGDGMTKLGNNVEHCFTRPGNYSVELRIYDKAMSKLVATQPYPSLDASGCPDLSPYPAALLGKVYNQRYGTALPDAEVRLTNRCTGEVTVVKSDGNGVYYAPLGKPCDYIVSATKGNFRPFVMPFSTLSDPNNGSFVLDIPLDFDDNSPVPVAGLDPGQQPVVGQTLELYHIYFDLDKYDIRRDAMPDLEHLYQMMVAYPGMAGELSAHTDSRASYEYNAWLSEKRARAARDYLVARGIDPGRITARGFGEMRLKNGCADGVLCSEEQHQRNRRVEFRVTDMGQTIQSREPDRFANALARAQYSFPGVSGSSASGVDLSGAMPAGRPLASAPAPVWTAPAYVAPAYTPPAPSIRASGTNTGVATLAKPDETLGPETLPKPQATKAAAPGTGVPASSSNGSAGKPVGGPASPWIQQPFVVPFPESRPDAGGSTVTSEEAVEEVEASVKLPLPQPAPAADKGVPPPTPPLAEVNPAPAKPVEKPVSQPVVATPPLTERKPEAVRPAVAEASKPTPTPAVGNAESPSSALVPAPKAVIIPVPPKPAPAPNPADAITYKVQVGVFRAAMADDKLARIMQLGEELTVLREGGYSRYLVGEAKTPQQAEAIRNQLVKAGFMDCFVTGWKNGAMLSKQYE